MLNAHKSALQGAVGVHTKDLMSSFSVFFLYLHIHVKQRDDAGRSPHGIHWCKPGEILSLACFRRVCLGQVSLSSKINLSKTKHFHLWALNILKQNQKSTHTHPPTHPPISACSCPCLELICSRSSRRAGSPHASPLQAGHASKEPRQAARLS